MSVQFGKWNFDGKPIDSTYFEKVKLLLRPYGPDTIDSHVNKNVAIIYRAFHTTSESRREQQPYLTRAKAVLTWDGRLDNRHDLIRDLSDGLTSRSTDVSIVAAAYELWGTSCFGKLIGDWALSIWEQHTASLILARDSIGVRHVYYLLDGHQVTWSTILDPLVLLADRKFSLCEEYIAGWFSYFPAANLTPYTGIQAVPPSCFVHIRDGKSTTQKYWNLDPSKRIRYYNDAEYEEHFRAVFRQSVRRRLRSDQPVLAELSGGMDSSSIVCMADTIVASGEADAPRLDTISYYDDSEPNWNERPYFQKVEEKRGRSGCHVNVGSGEFFRLDLYQNVFAGIPGARGRLNEQGEEFAACLSSQGNRVVLSGIGGDEILGGVPTPVWELSDLIARARFLTLARQLKLWALTKRVPWFHLLSMSVRRFLPPRVFNRASTEGPIDWVTSDFADRNCAALRRFDTRIKLLGPLPSFQANATTLLLMQKQLSCELPHRALLYEKRYPYLDRDLLEFVCAIPREQVVRPGRRRSLMRRALKDVVPREILERKRKAYVVRNPLLLLQSMRTQIETVIADGLAVRWGFLDAGRVADLTERILSGVEIKEWSLLVKAVVLELWLRSLETVLEPANTFESHVESFTVTRRPEGHNPEKAALQVG